MRVPEVLTNGFPDPSSAAPIASMALRSAAMAPAKSPLTHRLVLEREVDDTVGRCDGLAQTIEIVQISALHLGPGSDQRRGGAVRARESHDLVARSEQLGDDGGADVTGRAGDENSHG